MSDTTTPGAARSWIARHRVALIAGATAFLVAIGGGAGWAYLAASVTATGSITTQAVSVGQAGFADMGATYLPSDLTKTGSFTVTNTGSAAGTATVTIAAPEPWAGGLPIRVWPTSAGACTVTTPPGSALSGTWATPPALTPSLASGAAITYCVRTSIPDWKTLTSASGSQQANPAIGVSLSAAGWVATAASATHVQQTAGMYPLTTGFFDSSLSRWFTVRANANTGYCLDVTASGSAGATVIAYGCHSDSNQRWEFVPVSGTNQSLVTIKPRHAPSTRVTYSGTGAVTATAATGATTQQWYVQAIDSTRFQLVSAVTGLCLSLTTTSSAQATTVACDSASAQLRFQREPLTFGTSGTNVVLTFGGSNIPGSTLQRCDNAPTCSNWTEVTAVAGGSTSVTFPRTAIANNSTQTFRIIDGSSNVLWDGIRLNRSGTTTVTAVAGIG